MTAQWGNVFSHDYTFNKRFQPTRISIASNMVTPPTPGTNPTPNGDLLDLSYSYVDASGHNNGNVATVANNSDWTRTLSFTYDSLSRLTGAWTSATNQPAWQGDTNSIRQCWAESYSYDPWGNLVSLGPSGSSSCTGCTQESGFNFSGAIGNNNRITASGYAYDSAGNLIAAPPTGTTYTFDAENHLTSAGGLAYLYDGDGKRVGKAPSGTPTQHNYIYWYGTSSAPLEESDGAGNLLYREYYFNGIHVARAEWDWVDHFGLDALGNVRVVYGDNDPDGGWSDYYPFGGERQINPATGVGVPFKFTGKERDQESGLDNFGARFDASSMGRFMSPDPLGGHQEDPQTLNKYVYVRNNPLNITDPTGLDFYLQCTQTKDNGSTCQQQQVGTDSKGNAVNAYVQGTSDKDGNFTATQIGNDANGNLVDKTTGSGFYTGAVDGSGVQFAQQGTNTASAGIWANGSAETKFSQTSGAVAGFSFDFNQTSKQQTANGTFFYPGAPRDAYDAILKAGFSASMADDFFNPLHGYIGSYHHRSDGDPGTGKNSGHLIIRGVGPWHPWDTVPTRGDLRFGETNPNVNRIEHFTKDVF